MKNKFFFVPVIILGYIFIAIFVFTDQREQVTVYAIQGVGDDPGTALDDTGQDVGLVRWVKYQDRWYDQKWYIENYRDSWITDPIWVGWSWDPSLLE